MTRTVRGKCETCAGYEIVHELGEYAYCEDCLRGALGEGPREWAPLGTLQIGPGEHGTLAVNVQRPIKLDRARVRITGAERVDLLDLVVGIRKLGPAGFDTALELEDGETIRIPEGVIANCGTHVAAVFRNASSEPIRVSCAFGIVPDLVAPQATQKAIRGRLPSTN